MEGMERDFNKEIPDDEKESGISKTLENGVVEKYSEEETPIDGGGSHNTKTVELSFEIPGGKIITFTQRESADKIQYDNGTQKVVGLRIEFDSVRENEPGKGESVEILPHYIASHLFEFAQLASPERLKEGLERVREMYVFGCERDRKIYDTAGGEKEWFRAKADEICSQDAEEHRIPIEGMTIASPFDVRKRNEIAKLLSHDRETAMENRDHDFFEYYGAPDGEFKAVKFAYLISNGNVERADELWANYRTKRAEAESEQQSAGSMAAA